MPLPPIEDEALQVFLFGPGTGELVALRAPPDHWLIIDGCGIDGTLYAPELLTHYGAKPAMVIFTHPHLDHYKGLKDVIEDATEDPTATWPLLGMVAPLEAATRTGDVTDLVAYLAEGSSEHVVAAISDRWERQPSCKWTLQPNETKPLGSATVRVLSPTVTMRNAAQWKHSKGEAFDANQISAALAVEWNGHHIILGSDLVEKPGNGWTEALKVTPTGGAHRVLKIPHHCSFHALHDPLLTAGQSGAPWLATPFASKNLPNFKSGQGMDLLLKHRATVELTSLPRAHAAQAGSPQTAPIETLRPDGRHIVFDPTTPGFPDCFLMLSLRADGSESIHRGPGAVTVTR